MSLSPWHLSKYRTLWGRSAGYDRPSKSKGGMDLKKSCLCPTGKMPGRVLRPCRFGLTSRNLRLSCIRLLLNVTRACYRPYMRGCAALPLSLQLIEGDRQIADALACCMIDCVGDRRRDADNANLA